MDVKSLRAIVNYLKSLVLWCFWQSRVGDNKNRTPKGSDEMTGLEEAFAAGMLLSALTWGVTKVVWKYAIKGE
jgi:hypothetical protein